MCNGLGDGEDLLFIFWALIAKLWPFVKAWSDNNAEFGDFLVFWEIPVQGLFRVVCFLNLSDFLGVVRG